MSLTWNQLSAPGLIAVTEEGLGARAAVVSSRTVTMVWGCFEPQGGNALGVVFGVGEAFV